MRSEDSGIDLHDVKVVIAGGGRFGSLAASHCIANGSRVLIIDSDPGCDAARLCDSVWISWDSLGPGDAAFLECDAVEGVLDLLDDGPDLLAPCIPGHLAAFVLEGGLKRAGRASGPDGESLKVAAGALDPSVIVRIDTTSGTLVASFMPQGMLCAEGCPQDSGECPVTGRDRAVSMHGLLQEACASAAERSTVLKSLQLGEGVGGFLFRPLRELVRDAVEGDCHRKMGVVTACDCHGVITLYEISDQ